jgi:serine/threonine protein kinase
VSIEATDIESSAPDVNLRTAVSPDEAAYSGEQIDEYRLIEVVGEGGMGIIYKAEQRGALRRIVALKVIKLGMDTRAVIARFDAERQALAMMSHPSIARVYDAGSTTLGRPYFVMEFVSGEPITSYCD